MKNTKHIAILDFGSQYMHLISRRIRQLGVRSVIYPTDVQIEELEDAWGVIISGGPQSVADQQLAYDSRLFDLDKPILGLCYGHQLMAHHLGGVVTEAHNREYGKASFEVMDEASPLLKGLASDEQVWMSHWDSVTAVPEGFDIIGQTDDCPVAAMGNADGTRFGLQFHPEVHHSVNGLQILRNFVFDVCGAEVNWSMEEYIEELKEEIRQEVGDKKVFLLVSGGVDSTVAFALLEEILGKERVYGLHIDNGLMRKDESKQVHDALAAAGFDDLHVIDASDTFLQAVEGAVEPEEKRNIIGRTFLDVQKQVFEELDFADSEWLLGQGTIYPDTIESGGTKASHTIKTHHNRIPEVMKMIEEGRVVEPLKDLYKDEVREIGLQLGLPESLVHKWPFPGPGLGVRCLCAGSNVAGIDLEDNLNSEIATICEPFGVAGQVLPVKSVGVQGDQRSYQHPAVVQGELSWDQLDDLSVRLTNGIIGINRALWHVGGEVDFSQARVVEGYLTRDRLDLLREAVLVMEAVVEKYGIHGDMWQFPVVLLPLRFSEGGQSLVLRPVVSQEVMTAHFYQMAMEQLEELVDGLLAINGIEAVFYDITNKPPGTIEWE